MNAAELEATVEADSRRIDAIVAAMGELTSLLGLQVAENADGIAADRALRTDVSAVIVRVDHLEQRIGRVAWRGELESVIRRLDELELRGSNHLRYLDSLQSSLDRIAATAVEVGAGDHSKHVDRLADRGYVVVNLESSPPELLGSFVRVDEEVAFYLDEEATPRRAPLDCIAIVPPVEAAAIVAGRRPK